MFVSAQHKVVGVPYTHQLAGLWPSARVLPFKGKELILLPHGFTETKMLRNLGIEVPAPVLNQYNWPHPKGQPPFKVQKNTVGVMTTEQRAFNLNGMGTGKTRCTLWSFDFLRSAGLVNRMLVTAPLSTLDNVWRREAFRTTPHLSVGILYGTRAKRLKVLSENHDIYVINTDGLMTIGEELIKREGLDVWAIDEVALFRNGTSNRNKFARRLAPNMAFVWGLTGSPTPREPTDAWGQCKIITPTTVPSTFTAFREMTMTRINQFKWLPRPDATDIVFRVMQPAIRYTLDDVVELPQVVEQTLDVDMGPKQTKIYEHLRKHMLAMHEQASINAVNAGVMVNKLLQISLGYVYDSEGKTAVLDGTARMDALINAIDGCERKVLVFVPFKHALKGVVERLAKEGIEAAHVSGDTKKRDRDDIFNAFQNTNKYRVIAAHPGTMSHGLTLTAADTVIWFGPVTSLETFEQANARVRRIGQTHKQLVLMLQGTAAERRMYKRLRDRQEVQDALLDLFAENSPD